MTTKTILVDRIDQRLGALGFTARQASIKTGHGPDVIRNIQRAAGRGEGYNPRSDTILRLADVLETSPEWLLGIVDGKPLPKREDPSRPVKVFASVEGGNGSMIISNEPIDYAPLPNLLTDENDLYGVVVEGTSMIQAYRPGDTVWLHPRYLERRDEACVFRRHDNVTGDTAATIKWLVDFNTERWKVQQFNPPKEFDLKRSEWPECYRVLGKKNRA